jgi:hypothetical protein
MIWEAFGYLSPPWPLIISITTHIEDSSNFLMMVMPRPKNKERGMKRENMDERHIQRVLGAVGY